MATSGHKVCALPVALRQRPEAPPTTTARNGHKSSLGLLRGNKAAPRSSQTARARARANARPTHRSHAAMIAVRPTTTLSAPFRNPNAAAAARALVPRHMPIAMDCQSAAFALRFVPLPPAWSFCSWDPASLTAQPVLNRPPRISCSRPRSLPAIRLRSRPRGRNGRPAPCPTSTK